VTAALRVACVAALVSAVARPASGQELFPRFDVELSASYVASPDPRFNWIFEFGGDMDVVEWDGGRAVFHALYEAVAGEQFRRFDVNQGNYLLEGSVSQRIGRAELSVVWHHISRHLSDRTKRFPIDWNMIAGRVATDWRRGRTLVAWQADVRASVLTSFVDYTWEIENTVRFRTPLHGRTAAFGLVRGRVVGVDGSRGRGTQGEGRVEAGVRLNGTGAAAELFAALERRLDPYQVEFGVGRWFLAGFRLTSMP
jgi:hypothetical protein